MNVAQPGWLFGTHPSAAPARPHAVPRPPPPATRPHTVLHSVTTDALLTSHLLCMGVVLKLHPPPPFLPPPPPHKGGLRRHGRLGHGLGRHRSAAAHLWSRAERASLSWRATTHCSDSAPRPLRGPCAVPRSAPAATLLATPRP